jgi:oligosaccharide repeat unit polymerase
MAALLVYVLNRRARRDPIYLMLLVATGLGILVINNPFAAARMWLAITVIAFLAPFVLRRFRTGALLVTIAFCGITLLPSLNWSRYALSFDEWWDVFQLASPIDYLVRSSDVDSLGMLTLVHKWTDSFGHRWGMQIIGAFLFWFPRLLWSSKPIETGAMVTEGLGFEFTNLSPPIMSEPLVDFGLIGVPCVGALFGLLLARLDLTYWHGRESASSGLRIIDCIYPFWIGLVIFITRGGSFASLTWTTCFTVWILLLGGAQFGPQRPSATAPSGVLREPG